MSKSFIMDEMDKLDQMDDLDEMDEMPAEHLRTITTETESLTRSVSQIRFSRHSMFRN